MLAIMLAGCATSPDRPYSSTPMIIGYSDIEPSAPAAEAASVPAARRWGTRHRVRAGETLWAISKMYGIDVTALARANSIGDTGSIEVGQVLRIPSAASAGEKVNYTAARATTFVWPVKGTVNAPFGSKIDNVVNKGVDIKALNGSNVIASRPGRVVYCDPSFKGFGQTVIIDHMDGFQSVYSYNSDILVKSGQIVQQCDVIAKVGSSGRAREPMLHFEIRKNGEPQNPEFFLSRARL
ncbi:MAG: LysM peptidoglycan-binding domain-containing M23 family metallopeptidase [Candidatus Omnitrophica bacterium]|nr:LysM peptidoglycan-binding domain-containing M23 family metallopeptidase [Candidatus Omnitrophota bacterium]